jgi:hypothetical protein
MSPPSLKTIFSCLGAVLLFFAKSETLLATHPEQRSIGIVLSNISGYGLYWDAYRDSNWLLRPTGSLYIWKHKTNDNNSFHFNLETGMEIQRSLFTKDQRRFYCLLGGYYYTDRTSSHGEAHFKERRLQSFSFGSGVGVEYQFSRFVVGAHLGYKQFFDYAENHSSEDGAFKEEIFSLKQAGGLSLGFVL